MKRALMVCILVSCVAAIHAEPKVVTFPLPLQPNEEVVRLSGNPDFYTATTKLTIKGIVPKVEYWVVTSAGRTGPFTNVPTTSADEYPHIRSFFATYEDAGKYYIVYGPNKPGTTMGSIAEYSDYQISSDGRRWAAVVKSKLKPEAFDILTDKGVLDWYSEPELVGFTADNALLYWTKNGVPGTYYSSTKSWLKTIFTFWHEKEKIFSKQFSVSGTNVPQTYISPDAKEWGWADNMEGQDVDTTVFSVNFAGGRKKIKMEVDHEVYLITPAGQVLHADHYGFESNLYLDGIDTGINGKVVAVSPDRNRVAIWDGLKIVVDELQFDLSSNASCTFLFSADSKHFITID